MDATVPFRKGASRPAAKYEKKRATRMGALAHKAKNEKVMRGDAKVRENEGRRKVSFVKDLSLDVRTDLGQSL